MLGSQLKTTIIQTELGSLDLRMFNEQKQREKERSQSSLPTIKTTTDKKIVDSAMSRRYTTTGTTPRHRYGRNRSNSTTIIIITNEDDDVDMDGIKTPFSILELNERYNHHLLLHSSASHSLSQNLLNRRNTTIRYRLNTEHGFNALKHTQIKRNQILQLNALRDKRYFNLIESLESIITRPILSDTNLI